MKNLLFFLLATLFTLNANAQKNAKDEADILKYWDTSWKAYEDNDESKMWTFYAPNACEVYPDGSTVCGLDNIKAGYDQFKGLLEGAPIFTYSKPDIHFIDANNALLLANITTDVKLKGGQQIGGNTKFALVLHKEKGKWLAVFSSQTPVIPMPDMGK